MYTVQGNAILGVPQSSSSDPMRSCLYLDNKVKILVVFTTLLQSLLLPSATAWSVSHETTMYSSSSFEVVSSRRGMIMGGIAAASMVIGKPALAVSEEQGMMSAQATASLLRVVPTFAIVDKKGVPFMVVGEDAKVTGYFFTEYGEAARILKAAKESADRAIAEAKAKGESQDEIGTNPWKMARISTVPLDSAVTLATKSAASFGGGNYFRVAPSENDVEDALAITGQEDLAEGKVPLFYYADFTINVDDKEQSPLFFRKSELEETFRKTNKGTDLPPVQVTELFAVLAEMVKPEGKDTDLTKLVFVAPKESERKRKECEKLGGKEAPFFIGQRIIVL